VLAGHGCTAATAVLAEHGCTTAAAGGCPRTVVEGGAAAPWAGCRSCGTLGEHR
jgi:hypothetical protein